MRLFNYFVEVFVILVIPGKLSDAICFNNISCVLEIFDMLIQPIHSEKKDKILWTINKNILSIIMYGHLQRDS